MSKLPVIGKSGVAIFLKIEKKAQNSKKSGSPPSAKKPADREGGGYQVTS